MTTLHGPERQEVTAYQCDCRPQQGSQLDLHWRPRNLCSGIRTASPRFGVAPFLKRWGLRELHRQYLCFPAQGQAHCPLRRSRN